MTYNNLKFTVSDVARILKVEKGTVKTWAFKFAEYLGAKANPAKGVIREFEIEDIRIMAYVYTLWEIDPDIECIKIGLNGNSQYENPDIDNLITSLIPIFIDPPENMDETWKHGVLISGLASLGDMLTLARSFKLAGDRLVEIALENEEAWDLHNPALFNYRHSIELYLKILTGNYEHEHNLLPLYTKLKTLLKEEFSSEPPVWFERVILRFNDYDPGGTSFRYGAAQYGGEVFVDFIQMKKLMGWLTEAFQNILHRQEFTC